MLVMEIIEERAEKRIFEVPGYLEDESIISDASFSLKGAYSHLTPHKQFEVQMFDNLAKMLEKYKLSTSLPFQSTLAAHGPLHFPPAPSTYPCSARTFTAWSPSPTFPKYLYQGQLNSRGECDGCGIILNPGKSMSIGWWRNNKANGQGYMINTKGDKVTFEGKDGLWVGTVTIMHSEEIDEF